jgi:hypothetical protein
MSAIIEDAERERREKRHCQLPQLHHFKKWVLGKSTELQSHFLRMQGRVLKMMQLCNHNTCAAISAFKLVRFIPQKATQVLANA